MAKKKNDSDKNEVSNKRAALDLAFKSIAKKHGQALKWLSDVPAEHIDYIPTGSLSLDYAIGGGLPRGRITEIFGWESSGKSTLALSVAAEANKKGLTCLYVDAERALDPALPVAYGVDPGMFILEDRPLTAEEHFSIVNDVVSSGEIGVVVIDSVSSLVPRAVMDGGVGDAHVGVLARFLSQECSKLIHLIGETNTLFIFINQYREKVMRIPGDPKTTSGGNALRFYSSVRIEVSGTGKTAKGAIKDDNGVVIGHRMSFKVMKNKVGVPYRTGSIDLIYGQGYDYVSELVDLAVDLAIIDKSGSWCSFPEDNIKVQGMDAMRELVASDVGLHAKIHNRVCSMLGFNDRLIDEQV